MQKTKNLRPDIRIRDKISRFEEKKTFDEKTFENLLENWATPNRRTDHNERVSLNEKLKSIFVTKTISD